MRLTVVGCAGSYPNRDSPASCYVVEHEGGRLVLDMGNGSLGALHAHLDPLAADAVTAVLLSHCHVDHCVDVASLFVARHYYGPSELPRIVVVGPTDTAQRLAGIYGMTDPSMLDSALDIRVHEPVRTVGPFTIRSSPADHSVEAYCLRVEAGGRSLTYSGDTGPTPALAALAQNTNLALFEASYVGESKAAGLHMSAADAGRIASDAQAESLVLTHLLAGNDVSRTLSEAAAIFSGPIHAARPGLSLDV